MKVKLTGKYRKDVIAIARSQIGYCESDNPEELGGTIAGNSDYTEYGWSVGSSGRAWCSEFASWCIRQAGVSANIIQSSRSANVQDFNAPYYLWGETTLGGGSYRPQKGDLALFSWGDTSLDAPYLSHTAIITGFKKTGSTVELYVIHGNSGGAVAESTYYLDASDGSLLNRISGFLGYIVAPNYGSKKGRNRILQFDANGGKTPETVRKVAGQANYGLMPVPVRSGYRFTGWYTEKKGGIRVSSYMPIRFKGTRTLYAHWK